MLTIRVPLNEGFNDDTQMWEVTESTELELEHSLASVSKWEQTFEKPFLGDKEKTPEETLAYIMLMAVDPKTPPEVFARLSEDNFREINEYINAKMTATWFREDKNQRPGRDVITAEIIYHWMIHFNVWLEAEHWHLNKLLTLLRVCEQKSTPPKKMSRREQIAQRQKLNAERMAKYNTSG
ncbi:hypothetical protein SEA_PHERRYCRUZ_12 [Streptomyces phage PherryCruz]|nr:hypothetical protein SEA_RAVENPUFF_12 [Streptomyces phage RavenPuff]QBZ73439.1 hypothetical protein SEA_PHERRYCRUZ_12 [Streptomyces phage PherryCruz]